MSTTHPFMPGPVPDAEEGDDPTFTAPYLEGPPTPKRPAFRFSLGHLLVLVAVVAILLVSGRRFISVASALFAVLALCHARTAEVEHACRRRGTPLTPPQRSWLVLGSFARAMAVVAAYCAIAVGVYVAASNDPNFRNGISELHVVALAFGTFAGYESWLLLKWLCWGYCFPPLPEPTDPGDSRAEG